MRRKSLSGGGRRTSSGSTRAPDQAMIAPARVSRAILVIAFIVSKPPAGMNRRDATCEVAVAHPLEARLVQWRATQDKLKMEMLRQRFGIAEPVKRGMELKITREGEWRPQCLGGSSGVHRDILEGRDTEIGWEDVFVGKLMVNCWRERESFG